MDRAAMLVGQGIDALCVAGHFYVFTGSGDAYSVLAMQEMPVSELISRVNAALP